MTTQPSMLLERDYLKTVQRMIYNAFRLFVF